MSKKRPWTRKIVLTLVVAGALLVAAFLVMDEAAPVGIGVRVAGMHQIGFFDLRLSNIKAGFKLSDLGLDNDPFARLIAIGREEND